MPNVHIVWIYPRGSKESDKPSEESKIESQPAVLVRSEILVKVLEVTSKCLLGIARKGRSSYNYNNMELRMVQITFLIFKQHIKAHVAKDSA